MLDGLTVLYLEDEVLVAMDTADHLKSLDPDHVEVVHRLDKAREKVGETSFDIALLDINVDRGQTSIEFGRELAAKGTAVIFASASSEAAATLRAEGFHFIDKPFSLFHLSDTVKQAVAR